MMVGAFHLGTRLIDAVVTDLLNADSERGRRMAATFGLSPRGLELVATLLAALFKICLALAGAVSGARALGDLRRRFL